MEPGNLPFPASGIVPSTSTDLPSNEVMNGVAEGSGMSSKISSDPDTCRTALPLVTSTFPAIIAVEGCRAGGAGGGKPRNSLLPARSIVGSGENLTASEAATKLGCIRMALRSSVATGVARSTFVLQQGC